MKCITSERCCNAEQKAANDCAHKYALMLHKRIFAMQFVR